MLAALAYLWANNPIAAVTAIVGLVAVLMALTVVVLNAFASIWRFCLLFKEAYDRDGALASNPQIAYKRAWLLGDGFRGVVGKNYGVDEEAEGPGFHAYKSFESALNHPQPGNVYLEVLLSGVIAEHRLGYTASHQRVLQIITGSCVSCERPATYYSITVTSGGERQPIFVCRKHAVVKSGRLSQRIIRRLRGNSGSVEYHKPVAELVNDFSGLKHSNVVVSPYDGEEAFTPTEPPMTAETTVLASTEVAR